MPRRQQPNGGTVCPRLIEPAAGRGYATATEREQLHKLPRKLMGAFPDRDKWYAGGDHGKSEKPAD